MILVQTSLVCVQSKAHAHSIFLASFSQDLFAIYKDSSVVYNSPTHFLFYQKHFSILFSICFHICHSSKLIQTYLSVPALKMIIFRKMYIFKIFLPSHMLQKSFGLSLGLDFLQPNRNIKISWDKLIFIAHLQKWLYKFAKFMGTKRQNQMQTQIRTCYLLKLFPVNEAITILVELFKGSLDSVHFRMKLRILLQLKHKHN